MKADTLSAEARPPLRAAEPAGGTRRCATPRRRSEPKKAEADQLARVLRESETLDPLLKDQWLRVLPYLSPSHRRRLIEILASAEHAEGPKTQPDGDEPVEP